MLMWNGSKVITLMLRYMCRRTNLNNRVCPTCGRWRSTARCGRGCWLSNCHGLVSHIASSTQVAENLNHEGSTREEGGGREERRDREEYNRCIKPDVGTNIPVQHTTQFLSSIDESDPILQQSLSHPCLLVKKHKNI